MTRRVSGPFPALDAALATSSSNEEVTLCTERQVNGRPCPHEKEEGHEVCADHLRLATERAAAAMSKRR